MQFILNVFDGFKLPFQLAYLNGDLLNGDMLHLLRLLI